MILMIVFCKKNGEINNHLAFIVQQIFKNN
jgi:hypothetical protein